MGEALELVLLLNHLFQFEESRCSMVFCTRYHCAFFRVFLIASLILNSTAEEVLGKSLKPSSRLST